MIVIVGCIVVIGAVLGGFSMAGGHVGSLIHPSEFVTTTNSTPVRTVEGFKTHVLCVSELLGEGMKRIHNDESVSSLFKIDNNGSN